MQALTTITQAQMRAKVDMRTRALHHNVMCNHFGQRAQMAVNQKKLSKVFAVLCAVLVGQDLKFVLEALRVIVLFYIRTLSVPMKCYCAAGHTVFGGKLLGPFRTG